MSIKVITTDTELLIKYNTKYFEITDIDNILERSGCYM